MDKSDKVLNDIILDAQSNPIKPEVPKGVKFISIIGYLIAAFSFVIGILLLALGILVNLGLSSPELSGVLNQFTRFLGLFFNVIKDFSIVIGIILIILAAIEVVFSLALWRGRNWARWIIIIFSGLSAIGLLVLIIMLSAYGNLFYLLGFLISLILFLYLAISKKVRAAF